jgi:asparagine synthase (glutamine-hydrolysing)
MCGICGIYRTDDEAVDPKRVTRMRDAMTPRGPDAAGLTHGPGFALAHRRLSTVLPDCYLTKVDSGTMGVSLEARCLFLDLDVVELAMWIPDEVRFRRYEPKGLLRQPARRHTPLECVNRRKKGFVSPARRWLCNDWSDLVNDLILGPHVERRGWFRRPALERLVAEHRHGARRDYLLWSLLVLELWLRATCG